MGKGCQRPLSLPGPLFQGPLDLPVLETHTWRWKPVPSPLSTLSACSLLAAGSCLLVTSLLITQTLLPHDLCLVGNTFLSHNLSFLSHLLVVQLSSDSCQKQSASRCPYSLKCLRLPCSCILDFPLLLSPVQQPFVGSHFFPGFPNGLVVKNLPANAKDTVVQSLILEDHTCLEATKPVHHNY